MHGEGQKTEMNRDKEKEMEGEDDWVCVGAERERERERESLNAHHNLSLNAESCVGMAVMGQNTQNRCDHFGDKRSA